MKNSAENFIVKIEEIDIEEKILELIDQLPEGPKKKEFQDRFDEADDDGLDSIYKEIKIIFGKIDSSKNEPFSEYLEEEDFCDIKEECQDLVERVKERALQVVREALDNKMIKLGQGM